jgi:hypothetical protein
MPLTDELLRLAEQQLGLLTRRQLDAVLGPSATSRLLASSAFERLHRGVHALRGGAVHPHREAVAAALRVGRQARISGPVALERSVGGLDLGARFVILVRPPVRSTGVSFPLALDRDLGRDVSRLGEVGCVGPVDALLDTALTVPQLPARDLRLAHDRLRWAGLLAPGQLRARAEELGIRRRLAGHELLEMDGSASESDGERRLGRLLSRFAPSPEPQVWVTPDRRVDWYFRTVRTGLEYQGVTDHASAHGRARDERRDRELRHAGIRLSYVTAADLRDERTLVATVAGLLAARADELGVEAPRLVR